MELTVRMLDEEGISQTLYEGSVWPDAEVTTQELTVAQADFDSKGVRKEKDVQVPAVLDVVIAAPKPKEKAK